jgi:plastocyanin domain-containing protein
MLEEECGFVEPGSRHCFLVARPLPSESEAHLVSEFTPKKSGTFAFTCGMGMSRASIGAARMKVQFATILPRCACELYGLCGLK